MSQIGKHCSECGLAYPEHLRDCARAKTTKGHDLPPDGTWEGAAYAREIRDCLRRLHVDEPYESLSNGAVMWLAAQCARSRPASPAAAGEDARDAARYRWLRSDDIGNTDIAVCTGFEVIDVGSTGTASTYSDVLTGKELDAAIDAAIKEDQGREIARDATKA